MFNLTVVDVRFFTADIFEISLEKGGYRFASGECAVLFNSTGDSRPYSISSHPDEPVLRFLIRRIPGGAVSGWLAERRPGDRVSVTEPFGSFRPTVGQGPAVFVATGVGIAPFLSAMRSPREQEMKPLCFYGVRTLSDAVEMPLLQKRCNLNLAISREQREGFFHGRVTELLRQIPLPEGAGFFLCGYDAMIDDVFDWLRFHGVPADQIYTEVFFSSNERT